MSNEQKQKIAIANMGQKRSEETRRRISDALKAYWATIPFDEDANDTKESEVTE